MKISDVARIVDIYDELLKKCEKEINECGLDLFKWYLMLERKNELMFRKIEFIHQAQQEGIYIVNGL